MALAFLTIQMFIIPCLATCVVIRQESNSWRWAFFNLRFFLVVSLAMGAIVYWLANSINLI
jgi:Fe2+ transport system protein B